MANGCVAAHRGWHLTPDGHLVRPVRMRPSRPIPAPGDARQTGHSGPRASRVVIDPTRYPQIHLTDKDLGGKEAELHWEYADGKWFAYDNGTQVAVEDVPVRERIVPQFVDWGDWMPEEMPEPRTSGWAEMPAEDAGDDLWSGTGSRSRGAGLFDSDEEGDQTLNEESVNEGNAGDSHEDTITDDWSGANKSAMGDAPLTLGRLPLPDEESDFSEGYDELQEDETTSDERARAHSLLTRLFGQDALTAPAPPSAHEQIAEIDKDAEMPPAGPESNEEAAPAPTATERQSVPGVHMERLKDMFQPSADSGTFSLFDDLDMELGEDPLEETSAPVAPSVPVVQTRPTLPYLTREPGLRAALHRNGWVPFWATDSDADIEARWTENRAALTQGYKRIHREALKKRRRRVVGSRASAAAGGSALRRDARSA